MGPEALRVAGLAEALRRQGLTVDDAGNLSGPANPERAFDGGPRHLPEIVAWNRVVHRAVEAALGDNRLPILLGGDHSLVVGSIGAVADDCKRNGKTLRVIWLDAHADCNNESLSPSGNVHGMPVAALCGVGPTALNELIGGGPVLDASQIFQIGVRSVDAGERRLIHDLGISVFDMRLIDEIGMRSVMERALQNLNAETHLHVSFDVDFLDALIAPGVATAVQGGPNYREAQLCMEMIADTGCLGSLDIVELNPALDVRNATAVVAVDLVESLFGKSTLLRAGRPV